MRGEFVRAACFFSTLVSLAAAAVGIRSHWVADTVGYYHTTFPAEWTEHCDAWVAQCDAGGLLLMRMDRQCRTWQPLPDAHRLDEHGPGRTEFAHLMEEPLGYPYLRHQPRGWDRFGFGYYGEEKPIPIGWRGMIANDQAVVVPVWTLFVAGLVFPMGRLLRWTQLNRRLRRRAQSGLCGACGYDLRHTDSAGCPECGARKTTSCSRLTLPPSCQ